MSFLFVTVFFAFLAFFWVFLRVSGERLGRVTLVNFVFVALIVFSYVGIFPLYFFWDEYRFSIGIQDRNLIIQVFLLSSISIIFFLFAVIFTRKFLGLALSRNPRALIAGFSRSDFFLVAILTLISFIVLIKYISEVGNIALFVAMSSGAGDAILARSNMSAEFSGKYHRYSFFFNELASFLLFSVYSSWLIKKKRLDFLLLILLFFISVFSAVMTTEKGPVVWLLIGMSLTYLIVRTDGEVNLKHIFLLFSLFFCLLIVFYMNFMGVGGVFDSFKAIFSRAFTGSISPAYFYLEYYPEVRDYMQGASFPNPGGVFPFEPIPYSIEIMHWYFPELDELGVKGSMPTVFWGEAYANFGFMGVPVVSFFVGLYISIVSYFLAKIKRTSVNIGFIVWCLLYFKDLSVSGFSPYLFSIYFLLMLFVIFIFILFSWFFRVK